MTAKYTLNVEALALFAHTRSQDLTLTEAAAAAGISKAQFFRALHKRPINNLAFLSLCLWMEVNPYCFLLDIETGRGLAPLPPADVSRGESTETRGTPDVSQRAAA